MTLIRTELVLELPDNVGCDLHISGSYTELVGVFTRRQPEVRPLVEVVGVQPATFKSYIGGGEVGRFRPLMDQLQSIYAERQT